MKQYKKLFKAFLIILISVQFGSAGIGSSGAQFLQIGAGIRALSMGSAYAGYADGIDAIYWNPAGIANLNSKMYLNINHAEYLAEMTFDNFALTAPMLGGTFGLSGGGLLSGDIDVTTVEEPDGTGKTYTANDFFVGASYARNLTGKFAAGITLKFVNQNIAELSSLGWAMDIGAVYRTGLLNNLRLGFSVTNFGPDLRYKGDDIIFRTKVYQDETGQEEDVRAEYLTEEYQLPLKLQVGIAIDLINTENQSMVLAIDGINPSDQKETFGIGVEYILLGRYSLRGGYSNLNDKGFTAGGGLMIGDPKALNFRIDYGFEGHEYLGEIHRFGFNFAF